MRYAVLVFSILSAFTASGCSSDSGSGSSSASPAQPSPASPSGGQPSAGQPSAGASDDLLVLSDEFDDPATLAGWRRVYQTEQWGFDQLESHDVGATRPGWLTLVPYTSSWFEDWRGILAYKDVSGDFEVTTRILSTNRAGSGPPSRQYSLAGIMVRAPRNVTPATWVAGGENYVFLSLGTADIPGTAQTEIKTTTSSASTLTIDPAAGSEAWIRVARLGPSVICLIREEFTPWRVHGRFDRSDLPQSLQVGLTVYTDWENCQALGPVAHNNTLITSGQPDLRAQADFVRYRRPQVPAAFARRVFHDPGSISDAELLSFLGN